MIKASVSLLLLVSYSFGGIIQRGEESGQLAVETYYNTLPQVSFGYYAPPSPSYAPPPPWGYVPPSPILGVLGLETTKRYEETTHSKKRPFPTAHIGTIKLIDPTASSTPTPSTSPPFKKKRTSPEQSSWYSGSTPPTSPQKSATFETPASSEPARSIPYRTTSYFTITTTIVTTTCPGNNDHSLWTNAG
jgi:hypothetical protein